MSFRTSRDYGYNLDTVRQNLKRALRDCALDVVDEDRQMNKIIFKSKRTLLRWKQLEHTIRYTDSNNGVIEVVFIAHPDDDRQRASKLAATIFERADKLLPSKKER